MNVCNLSNNSTVWHGRDVPSYFQFFNNPVALAFPDDSPSREIFKLSLELCVLF